MVVADDERAGRIAIKLERIAEEVRTGSYLKAYARQRAEFNTELTFGWLLNQLKRGRWGELARSVLRARPEHVGMLGRYATQKLRALWRKQRATP